MSTVIAVVVSLAIGFGLGRVKNRAKLAEVRGVLEILEAHATSDLKSILAAIREKL
jgi:hypothetical protein